jgi:hypothetical protein
VPLVPDCSQTGLDGLLLSVIPGWVCESDGPAQFSELDFQTAVSTVGPLKSGYRPPCRAPPEFGIVDANAVLRALHAARTA